MPKQKEIALEYYEKSRTVKQMLQQIRNGVHFDQIIKTASKTGWFTNGILLTRLTSEERQFMDDLLARRKSASKADSMDVDDFLRKSPGTELYPVNSYDKTDDYPYRPPLVKLRAKRSGEISYVPTWAWVTICERHPDCTAYQGNWHTCPDDPIIFISCNYIYAMLMPFNIR